ncbi:MAG: right-handed parallel beta-helix repeat-containing protein [Ignavibacteriales bacterium]|nr:right-handed parallel beta-helix repeat-containing protein [Ignavibacteriales bacterium]
MQIKAFEIFRQVEKVFKKSIVPTAKFLVFHRQKIALLFFFFTTPALAQAPSFPQPDIRKEETISGDLVLNGGEIKVVENTKLHINGNIYLRGNAQLVIRQSIIEINHYPREEIFANDSAIVRADTSIFRQFIHSTFADKSRLLMTNCFLINLIAFTGNAQGTIRNSTIFQDRFGLIQAEEQTNVLIENSTVGAMGLFLPASFSGTIDSLKPGTFEHWSVKENISSTSTYNIVLNKTEVKDNPGYSGGFEMGWNLFVPSNINALTVTNSTLNKLVVNFANENVLFSNLLTRTRTDFAYKAIHITNTVIQGQWGIHVTNGETTIENCKGVWLWPVGTKNTTVTNSEVNEFDPRNYSGTLIMNNATMTDGCEVFENCNLRMTGSVKVTDTSPLFSSDSKLTRTFEVVLQQGTNATPLVGVSLTVKKNGVTVWQGMTDAVGKANFDIMFDYNNNRDVWILSTNDTTIRLKKSIQLVTSTPVIINLEKLPNDTRWVPAVYVDGKKQQAGLGTKGDPFPTIQEGVNSVAGIGVVRVASGEYKEEVTLKDSVFLLGASPANTIIKGNVFAFDVLGAQISGFTVKDTNTAGIHCRNAFLKITNNIVINQPHNGIHSSHSTLTIVNNVLSGNGQNGILVIDSSSVIVKNNIFVRNSQLGIGGDTFSTASIGYNDAWGNGAGSFAPQFFPASTNIAVNPLFIDTTSGNYSLQAGSPCRNAGDPDPQYNDGDGSRNDMGAFGGPLGNVVTSADDGKEIGSALPSEIVLYQNYPNPFNPETAIRFGLPSREWIVLSIYNLLGQRVRLLFKGEKDAGQHVISWDGKDDHNNSLGSGFYVCALNGIKGLQLRKILLIK